MNIDSIKSRLIVGLTDLKIIKNLRIKEKYKEKKG